MKHKNKNMTKVKISKNKDEKVMSELSKKLNIRDQYKLPKIFYTEGLGDILDLCNHAMEIENDDSDLNSIDEIDVGDRDIEQNDSFDDCSINSDESNLSKNDEFEKIAKAHKSIIPVPRAVASTTPYVVNRGDKINILTKSVKVLLNKLNDTNMNILLSQYREIVSKNGFNDSTEEFCKSFSSFIIQSNLLPDRIILIHSTFASILHFTLGNEFMSVFLRSILTEFDLKFVQLPSDSQSKYCQNIIVVICILYFLESIGIDLINDIIHNCIARFTEQDIEMILLILKHCGFHMRVKTPLALKTIIQSVHDRLQTKENVTKRETFMVETLTAIQHNNPSKVTDYDPSLFEHFSKIHKDILKNQTREGLTINIKYQEIISNDQSNKWWLVGSAYSGPSIDQICDIKCNTSKTKDNKNKWPSELLEVAKDQKYITKTKIDIFCTLMSSEGAEDAYNKLCCLNLKGKDRDEIIRIIVSGCIQESPYNEFYSEVVPFFIKLHRTFKCTLQFNIWDILRKLGDFEKFALLNIQFLIVDLFLKECLNITLFKIVEFDRLDIKHTRFYTELFGKLLTKGSNGNLKIIFSPLSSNEKLENLREALLYFIMTNMSEQSKYSSLQNKIKIVSGFSRGYEQNISSL